jgi:hypothetical protein
MRRYECWLGSVPGPGGRHDDWAADVAGGSDVAQPGCRPELCGQRASVKADLVSGTVPPGELGAGSGQFSNVPERQLDLGILRWGRAGGDYLCDDFAELDADNIQFINWRNARQRSR